MTYIEFQQYIIYSLKKIKKQLSKISSIELPKNIGLIDTESEEGNVYDKEQVDELLPTKNLSNSDQNISVYENRKVQVEGRLNFTGNVKFDSIILSDDSTINTNFNSISSDGNSLFYTNNAGEKNTLLTTNFHSFIMFLENLTDTEKQQIFIALGSVRVIKLSEEDAIPTNNNAVYLKQIT